MRSYMLMVMQHESELVTGPIGPDQQLEQPGADEALFSYLVALVRESLRMPDAEEAVGSIRRGLRVLDLMGVLPDK